MVTNLKNYKEINQKFDIHQIMNINFNTIMMNNNQIKFNVSNIEH